MKTTKQKIVYNKKKVIPQIKWPQNKLLILPVGIVGLVLLFGLFLLGKHEVYTLLRPIPSNVRKSLKSVPPDMKKAIVQEQKTATISATLHIPILMYHYVEYVQDKKDTERQKLNVNPNIFELQIQTLIAAHYTFITAKDLGDILDGKMSVPQNPIILTFDDGHWDLDTSVLPILKKYNVHATAYIVPGFIGTNTDSLTPKEMQDVVNSGLIDVGAHTMHHISLKSKPLATVEYEVDQSKAVLENTYHIHVYSFAYPYGTFDKQTLNVVKQAGFTTAASTIAGNEQSNQNRFFLFRVRPGYLTGQALLSYLNYKWPQYKYDSGE